MRIRQNVSVYSGAVPLEAEFHSKEELLAIPWVNAFQMKRGFAGFSLEGRGLMLDFTQLLVANGDEEGAIVVGEITDGEARGLL